MIILLGLVLGNNAQSQSRFFIKADLFFSEYVHHGLVDYQSISNSPVLLNELVSMIEQTDLGTLKGQEYKAFLINTYNIMVIDNVINNYPVQGPMEIEKFFEKKVVVIGGALFSLNEIEKGLLFPIDKDARLHFALVCAAKGCPPIRGHAFLPAGLDKQLDQQTQLAMESTTFMRVSSSDHSAELSQIFSWYSKDFGNLTQDALRFINGYRKERIPLSYHVSFYEYNWLLNEYSIGDVSAVSAR